VRPEDPYYRCAGERIGVAVDDLGPALGKLARR